ncbi:hypothetical protein HY375_00700 [Candidatus Berkelbacteria bacterium]|nr:hypothetical protein [Candidatus Berkelbacteria bacterium]
MTPKNRRPRLTHVRLENLAARIYLSLLSRIPLDDAIAQSAIYASDAFDLAEAFECVRLAYGTTQAEHPQAYFATLIETTGQLDWEDDQLVHTLSIMAENPENYDVDRFLDGFEQWLMEEQMNAEEGRQLAAAQVRALYPQLSRAAVDYWEPILTRRTP